MASQSHLLKRTHPVYPCLPECASENCHTRTYEQILKNYPQLTADDIQAAL
ncbi:MAG: DUF433 domain-containing protein, partial [Dongiaceae bacterium]